MEWVPPRYRGRPGADRRTGRRGDGGGRVRQVQLPWAEARARFTTLFERLAIDVLGEASFLGADRLLRLIWDEAWHIMERAVARGQRTTVAQVPAYMGVDEKTIAKGHQYLTLTFFAHPITNAVAEA